MVEQAPIALDALLIGVGLDVAEVQPELCRRQITLAGSSGCGACGSGFTVEASELRKVQSAHDISPS